MKKPSLSKKQVKKQPTKNGEEDQSLEKEKDALWKLNIKTKFIHCNTRYENPDNPQNSWCTFREN